MAKKQDDLSYINGTDEQDGASLQDSLHDDAAYSTSFLDDTLDDVKDLVAYEGECKLRVTGARIGRKSPEKAPYILIRFELPDYEDAKDLTHVIGLADPQIDSAKESNTKRLRLREFYEAFGVDYSQPVNIEALTDLEGWAILALETSPDYGEQSRVRRFVASA